MNSNAQFFSIPPNYSIEKRGIDVGGLLGIYLTYIIYPIRADQNLFNSEGHLSKYQYHYNVSPPNWKETGRVSTSFNQLHSLQPSGSGSSSYKVPTSIVIDLSQVYLVNNIALELVKSRSDYIIYVSRDNKTWRPLIDYSTIKKICTGVQALWFPKQAVR